MMDRPHDAFRMAANTLENKCYTITLKQLKALNLPPTTELSLFGRTSNEWEKN